MNWELIGHVYDKLDETPNQKLENSNAYGQMMWAPSFRFHKGTYYLCFAANDTKKTYLFTTTNPEGTWEKNYIDGFYHDSSLLFDDDDRIYLVYGNRTIHLLELAEDLSGPRPGGLTRIVAVDTGDVRLGYEGAHLQKRNGKYYLFVINWPNGEEGRRSEWCFIADSLEGEFVGRKIIDDDLNFHNQGIAQGGMVDTPDGDWYMFMFQDRGAVGRIPIMIPMEFEDDYPIIKGGRVPLELSIPSTQPNYNYAPLNDNDDFNYEVGEKLKHFWQFNHQPHDELWSITERKGAFRLTTDKLSPNLTQAYNTLTQRTIGPKSSAWVTVDGTQLKEGDYAGICALQGCYGAIALTKRGGKYDLVMISRPADYEARMGDVNDTKPPIEQASVQIDSPIVTLKIAADFEELKDEACFFYQEGDTWRQLGDRHQLYFKLDHFVGCRFGLFLYSTENVGGKADFLDFNYQK